MKQTTLLMNCGLAIALVVSGRLFGSADGHGMMLDPPSRSSMWRYGFNVQPNYNENGLNCGGYGVQFNSINQGRCGECGDEWSLPRPRANDEGGIYGTGIIGQTYAQASWIRLTVELTSNHLGYFEFRLCPKQSADELSTQQCFDQHLLTLIDGSTQFYVSSANELYFPVVQLPADVSCDYCVLQWRYTAGNNWGVCKNGTSGIGCGSQETFVNCADIAIL